MLLTRVGTTLACFPFHHVKLLMDTHSETEEKAECTSYSRQLYKTNTLPVFIILLYMIFKTYFTNPENPSVFGRHAHYQVDTSPQSDSALQ